MQGCDKPDARDGAGSLPIRAEAGFNLNPRDLTAIGALAPCDHRLNEELWERDESRVFVLQHCSLQSLCTRAASVCRD